MNFFNTLALATFFLVTIFFFMIRSRPILFHFLCAMVLCGFVFWSGRTLTSNEIPVWILLTVGLILYWFGLVIVRVMLTRSVSLRMLSNYDRQKHNDTASEGIAQRLMDAQQFGLVVVSEEGYRLTLFGRVIGAIVASSYVILRIK